MSVLDRSDTACAGGGRVEDSRLNLKTKVSDQNMLSKQSENNKQFIFVEVGSYLGESLEIWGDLSHLTDVRITSA